MAQRRRKSSCKKSPQTRNQSAVLLEILLSARRCETWLTLKELERLTTYSSASISAQLRHLRKPAFGGHCVEKRIREMRAEAGAQPGIVWEYALGDKEPRKAHSKAKATDRENLGGHFTSFPQTPFGGGR